MAKVTRRAKNPRNKTRKQIAGASLLRGLPDYIPHDKYVRDNLRMYYSDELLHKKKKHHIALREKAKVVKELGIMGVNKPPPNFSDFRDKPEYISHRDYQDNIDYKYYYTKETYHKKVNGVEVSPVVVNIVEQLIKMPIIERRSGKYISDILLSATISNKDKYDAIRTLILNGFNSRYVIPEKQMTILKWSIFSADDKETEKIALLLLDVNSLPYEETDLLSLAVTKTNIDLLPQKLIDTGYRPNTSELSSLGYYARFRPITMSPKNREWLINYFKARRLQHVATLRLKKPLDSKRLTGVSAPKTAFVIMGHGAELSLKRTQMPENCVLVTQAHSGEVTYYADRAFFALFNYDIKPQILDPITNYERISGALLKGLGVFRTNYSSLAVFRTGDLFPESIYSLLTFWDSDTPDGRFIGKPNRYYIIDSGIAQYPFNRGAPQRYILDKSSTDYRPLINIFSRSIYPTSTQIRSFIEAIPNPKTIETIVKKLLESPLIKITQSQLFAKLGSGVYYNLVCRATRSEILSRNESGRLAISDEARKVMDSAHKLRPYREIILGIEEAEAERKDLIERLHLDDDRHFDISEIDSLLTEIKRKITSGNMNPRLPYLKYLHSKKYYKQLLLYYGIKLKEAEAFSTEDYEYVLDKMCDLRKTVSNPQHLSESNLQTYLHLPQKPITPEEKTRQQKQKAAHNQWLASHPNNNSDVQKPENFEERARQAELEAQNKLNYAAF